MDEQYLKQVLTKEVGGNHYQQLKKQPIELILECGFNFVQGSIVKYILRAPFHPKKEECYKKALHYCEFGKANNETSLTQGQELRLMKNVLDLCQVNNFGYGMIELLLEVGRRNYSKVMEHVRQICTEEGITLEDSQVSK